MLRVIGCITREHDLRLIGLAACLCALACYTTLSLLAASQTIKSRSSWIWLGAAACVFGCGVWSLHFVAMLAFMPDLPIAYSVPKTVASFMVAMTGTILAFSAWRLSSDRLLGSVLGGTLLGLAVGFMHYCGIAAMRVPGRITFDKAYVVASIVVGVAFAILALARSANLSWLRRRFEVSGWLALSVCSVHFTGMAALSLDVGRVADKAEIGSGWLAITVGSVSLTILLVSLCATMMEQHLAGRTIQELKRMRMLGDISREVLIICRAGIVLEINAAGGRMFGAFPTLFVGREILELIAEPDRASVQQAIQLSSEQARCDEIKARTLTGKLVEVELSSNTIDYKGVPARVVMLRDLSDRKRDEARIRHLAHHDPLTDLPNRFLLQERLTHALATATETECATALLYLDLDRFKPVNDLLGHAGGDMLLVQVADRLRAELRSVDTLARVGGDEFVIVMSDVGQPEKAAHLASRIIEVLNRPFDIDGSYVEIGASIGIALYPGDGDCTDSLVHAADTALYRAKTERRGTFRFFERAMDEHLQARRALEQDLRHAADRDQLVLHYQPLVDCSTGEVDGFEALVRWNHPQRGFIAPGEFIPLAEETGAIMRIGEWVLNTACAAAKGWDKPCCIAVNVSPVQFRHSDLPEIVSAALARSGLPGHRLEIEITEGILMEDIRRAISVLSAIRAMGVRIALDDFGTGYSSLSYLRSFKFDKLKIDKSFINELGLSKDADMIVRTIIGLAHNLGMSIVAEGVETPQQLSMIREHMCDQVQGYLLGRPMQMDGSIRSIAGRSQRVLLETLGNAA